MFNRLNSAISTFNSFDKILGTSHILKLKQKNSLRFYNQANLQTFLEFMYNSSEK